MPNWSELKSFLRGAVPKLAEDQNDLLWATSSEFPASIKWMLQARSNQVSHIVDNICSFLIVAYADTLNYPQWEQKVSIYNNWNWDDEFLRGLELRLGTHFLQNSFLKEWWLWQRLIQFIQSNPRILLRENVTLSYDQDEKSISIHKFRDLERVEEEWHWEKASIVHIPISSN
jgi:hypothetical protein